MGVHKRYSALGRGLDALISTDDVRPQGSSTINEIAISQIEANPNQPRREFDEEALQELANSIREIGIIQPITLRQVADDRYQIIAGERRWRASQMAGLTAIPAYIRTIKDENVMELALVENIQREDLNAIEIALAYEHDTGKSVGACGQEPYGNSKLPETTETSCTGADGIAEEGDRHGTCTCAALHRLSVVADKGVQGNTEERLLCA